MKERSMRRSGRQPRVWYHGTFSESGAKRRKIVAQLPSLRRVKQDDWYIRVYAGTDGKRYADPPRQVKGVEVRGRRAELTFKSGDSHGRSVPAFALERLVKMGKPSINQRWLLISNRVPTVKLFEAFGMRAPTEMKTFLLSWNPLKSPDDFGKRHLAEFRRRGRLAYRWWTVRKHGFPVGSRVFLMRTSVEPKGLIGSGMSTRGPHLEGRRPYVGIEFDRISKDQPIMPLEALTADPVLRKFDWLIQGSGVELPARIASVLEERWPKPIDITAGSKGGHDAPANFRLPHGAGFGTPDENKKVEKAAINAVERRYLSNGWRVESVEPDKVGYDLRCWKGSEEDHVEVKGVRGTLVKFPITGNEIRRAATDKRFVLCVVTSALSNPFVHPPWRHKQVESAFSLTPLAYMATLEESVCR